MERLLRRLTYIPAACLSLLCGPSTAQPVTVNALAFGATGNGIADDHSAIQRAIDYGASTGKRAIVELPATERNTYYLARALRLRSNVTLKVDGPDTVIKCQGNAPWPLGGCLLFGTANASDVNRLPTFRIRPVEEGASLVTLSNPADTAQFRVNDIVDLETNTTFRVGSTARPSQLAMFVVSGVDRRSGELMLGSSVPWGGAQLQIRKLTNLANSPSWPDLHDAAGVDTRIPMYASQGVSVSGGVWIANGPRPFSATGGCLNCAVKVHEIDAGFGLGYGNLLQNCVFQADLERISRIPIELAFQSNHNAVNIGAIEMTGLPEGQPSPPWAIAVDEGAHDNRIHVGRLDEATGDTVLDYVVTGNVAGGEAVNTTVFGAGLAGGRPLITTYRTKPGDTAESVAAGVAAALSGNPEIVGRCSAKANPAGAPGHVYVACRTGGAPVLLVGSRQAGLTAYLRGSDVVRVDDAQRNQIEIDSVTGGSIPGWLVHVASTAFQGTPPLTDGNVVILHNARLDHYRGKVKIDGTPAAANSVRVDFAQGQPFELEGR